MSYTFIIYTDTISGLRYKSKFPLVLERAEEDIEIMKRHVKEDLITFQIEKIEGTYESLREIYSPFIQSKYEPNPFNAERIRKKDVQIQALPDDPRNLSRKTEIDYVKEEIKWVHRDLDYLADRFYQICLDDYLDHYKIYGSLAHRGLINKIFDYYYNSYIEFHKKWIELIGDHFDPEKLSNLKSFHKDSTYEQGFSTREVEYLCDYCEIMFGIDRFRMITYLPRKKSA